MIKSLKISTNNLSIRCIKFQEIHLKIASINEITIIILIPAPFSVLLFLLLFIFIMFLLLFACCICAVFFFGAYKFNNRFNLNVRNEEREEEKSVHTGKQPFRLDY